MPCSPLGDPPTAAWMRGFCICTAILGQALSAVKPWTPLLCLCLSLWCLLIWILCGCTPDLISAIYRPYYAHLQNIGTADELLYVYMNNKPTFLLLLQILLNMKPFYIFFYWLETCIISTFPTAGRWRQSVVLKWKVVIKLSSITLK